MKLLPFLEPIHHELTLIEEKIRNLAEIDYEPLTLAFSTLMASGGKRLRPATVVLFSRFYDIEMERIVALAAAVESLHTATLVHDDVVDSSLIRRGQPTLNAIWSSGATILAGDYLFARAAGFAAETRSVDVMTIFSRTLKIICDGELRQLFSSLDWRQPREAYYRRIFSKTASLFVSATESVGLLGQATPRELQALKDYGNHLGIAFQIIDDILDFVGDESVLGKPVGSDLRHGTVTLPLFYYLQEHPEVDVPTLYAQGQIDQLVHQVRESTAIGQAQEEAESFAQQAKAALEAFPASAPRDILAELADYVVVRQW
ncbi:MAG: polyprenyl synthetase family protein [Chloroflexi bacterium]|nr:polyprenyl synthetase family protein [Chloroflexota bacterium]